MATTKSATTTAKRKPAAKPKPRRTPAARTAAAKPAAASATTSSTRPASRVAQVQQLAERAVLIPVGVALAARDRVAQVRRSLSSNVELVSNRVESVVQNGVSAGIKLVNGAQDRISKLS